MKKYYRDSILFDNMPDILTVKSRLDEDITKRFFEKLKENELQFCEAVTIERYLKMHPGSVERKLAEEVLTKGSENK